MYFNRLFRKPIKNLRYKEMRHKTQHVLEVKLKIVVASLHIRLLNGSIS